MHGCVYYFRIHVKVPLKSKLLKISTEMRPNIIQMFNTLPYHFTAYCNISRGIKKNSRGKITVVWVVARVWMRRRWWRRLVARWSRDVSLIPDPTPSRWTVGFDSAPLGTGTSRYDPLDGSKPQMVNLERPVFITYIIPHLLLILSMPHHNTRRISTFTNGPEYYTFMPFLFLLSSS